MDTSLKFSMFGAMPKSRNSTQTQSHAKGRADGGHPGEELGDAHGTWRHALRHFNEELKHDKGHSVVQQRLTTDEHREPWGHAKGLEDRNDRHWIRCGKNATQE
mmetsp:Transcript_49469/g.89552  ORF Transcript_49469/g.89552 Transcript_49469/m.89552 type:complete len:104 (-) Transcript_49469:210-521(-)